MELMLVISLLGLGGLGFFSLRSRRNASAPTKYQSTGIWTLAGLIGLAILAVIQLIVVSLIQI